MTGDITAVPEHDKNVLFAIIASRLKFVTPREIADAYKSLGSEKEGDLGEILVSMGHITEETRALISPLVEVEIAEHRGDVNATLASFGGDDIFESFGGLEVSDEGSSFTETSEPEDKDSSKEGQAKKSVERVTREHSGRYKFKKEYGKGGIGRVLLVFDEHIGRDVALKELLGQRVDGSENGATKRKFTSKAMIRFLREARITGQLEHPGIVPLNELREKFMNIIRKYRPKTVMTFDPWALFESHPDHRRVAFAAVEAISFSHFPFSIDHIRRLLSALAETAYSPSPDTSTDRTGALCPCKE